MDLSQTISWLIQFGWHFGRLDSVTFVGKQNSLVEKCQSTHRIWQLLEETVQYKFSTKLYFSEQNTMSKELGSFFSNLLANV